MKLTLDLNCDLGEGFGVYQPVDDEALLAEVTSANVACGFHAGDPATMARVARAAVRQGRALGAHPGLPDLQGFGRREMKISPAEAFDLVVYQVGAMQAVARAAGTRLAHVKAHGALYNMAAKDPELALAIARAVQAAGPDLMLYALSGSAMVGAARQLGLPVACEVFADRSYQADGTLTPRGRPGAMITDVEAAVAQVLGMLRDGTVRAITGETVRIEVHTLCLHGDQPGALVFAKALRATLNTLGVELAAPTVQSLENTA